MVVASVHRRPPVTARKGRLRLEQGLFPDANHPSRMALTCRDGPEFRSPSFQRTLRFRRVRALKS